ncbi:NADPH-dependent FMN reductase [Pseudophaeobacter leonis]|uniref:NADPH-dependent FMN reductase n=1 Tax=Pseudophaeobacter leonis TaxID=1144477 RepID=UPI0009F2516F|nr:NADPH-dependent FMN reductase [Pseudophaeobacter leonis]
MTNLLFVIGSLRAASASMATARAIVDQLGAEVSCSFADIGGLPHYNADLGEVPEVTHLIKQLHEADGLVFVTPEYNYSIPGVLKNAIDWASRPAFDSVFKDKKCIVISVSGGSLGGVRAQSHLKYILNGMLAQTYTCKEIVIPMASAKIEEGKLNNTAAVDFITENMRGFIASF